jgi:hypothetical protein
MKPQVGKDEAIAEITRRLVEFYHPLRIYLSVLRRGVTPAPTATWIFWWSYRMTSARSASTQVPFTHSFPAPDTQKTSFHGERPTSKRELRT